MQRVYNFSAGPAVFPVPVLERIRDEMLSLPGVGASILEISHRSQPFIDIANDAERRLRQLLSIPEDYAVLFLQGGSRLQFSMIPMNLAGTSQGPATYVVTGAWGKMAAEEATKFGEVAVAYDAKKPYDHLPAQGEVNVPGGAAYVHYTSNETIQGVQFPSDPDFGDAPLVCDASSDFLHRPVDVAKYGLIYACAQKNAGPAGVTVVIVRKALLERSQATLPTYMNFKQHAEADMLNTPPTFAIYALGLIAKWVQEDIGGLAAMHERNKEKASLLYQVIDEFGDFYKGHAQVDARSLMNVTFRLPGEEDEKAFVKGAKERQLTDLKGHRSVGGIRASIYNAMPREGVEALASFMREFAQSRG
ncbi:MAG TPA: 3-phosphoserine/phosphohydroxythreonine transaminase [Pirellulaceae bacterium]|jgi:phosphoserine aminotransferase|nr:3-phosphoserine/phosphohydroxythreonine transaminase [Pirellulaceae bacterium]